MTAVSAVLPEVHLEVRQASGRSATFALDHVDFLIGAVPGCDLRVPGADLPSVLCLIMRQPGAVRLRKLAPTQLLLVNGQTATNVELADGDRITLGAIDIYVRIGAATQPADGSSEMPSSPTPPRAELQKQLQVFRAQVVRFNEERSTFAAEHQRQQAEANARQQQLDQRLAKLERDEKHWQKRRLDIQKEIDALAVAKQSSNSDAAAADADLKTREERLAAAQREVAAKLKQYESAVVRLDRRQGHLERREAEDESKSAELESRIQQLQRDGAELENQASQLDEWRTKLSQEEDRLGKQKQEVDTTAAQMAQRAALV